MPIPRFMIPNGKKNIMCIPERFTTFLSLYNLCVEGFLDYSEDIPHEELMKKIKCNVRICKASRLVCMELFQDGDIIFKSQQYDVPMFFTALVKMWWESKMATSIQAQVRGMLTRRKVHFALLSPDDDALARVMGW